MHTDDNFEDQGKRYDQRAFSYKMVGWAILGFVILLLILLLDNLK